MLTPEMQGMFVCDALNHLPHPEDVAEQNEFSRGCCPDCCAPCYALRELDQQGILDDVVLMAPEYLWVDIAWRKDGKVNREWLAAVWDCQSIPRCDRTDP